MKVSWNDIDPTGELASIFARMEGERVGSARQALWGCEDGWTVGYTTERITGGPFAGAFAAMAYKPTGKGARTGKAASWVRVYYRRFATRKAARRRAEVLYYRHSPKAARRHGAAA